MKNWLTKLHNFQLPAEKPWQRLLWNVGSALMGGLLLTFGVLIATAQSLAAVPALLAGHTAVILWSTLFFALLSLTLGLLTKRLCWGYLLVTAAFLGVTIANHFKALITAMPLELYELALITRLGAITTLNAKSISISGATVLSALIPLLWFAFLLVFSKKLFTLDWKWSLSAVGGAAALFLLVFVLLADPLIYTPAGFPLDQKATQGEVYEKTFVPLGLWRSVLYRDDLVDTSDPSTLENIMESIDHALQTGSPDEDPAPTDSAAAPSPGNEPVQPNVIVILSESFFDVTRLEQVHFDTDPLAEYHALQEESVSGKFYSRTLGYGTCNIEIEVLTGINSEFLAYGDDPLHWDSADLGVFTPVPAMMKNAGYYTSFLHMFNDSIYNRTSLFSHMGFEDMYFPNDFGAIDPEAAQAEKKGKYWEYVSQHISGEFCGDAYMTELLIDLYEQKEPDGPVFLYAASMENHTPYSGAKYPSYDHTFTTDVQLSSDGLGTLKSYVQGAANATRALCDLVDYFRQVEEPTIIVFYGDHRPGLGLDSGDSVYNELGVHEGSIFGHGPELTSELYSSNYLIWANDPALLPAEPGTTDAGTSPVFLGAEIMQAAEVPLTRWWQMVSDLNSLCQAYNEYYFVDADGVPHDAPPETLDTELFTQMEYALSDAKNERFITDRLNEVL